MAYNYNYNFNTNAPFQTDQEALAWATWSAAQNTSSSQSQGSSQSSTPPHTASYQPNYQPNYQSNYQPNYQPNFYNPMQIVIEPAEQAQPESAEGANSKKKGACERCKKLKVKCEYPVGLGGCNRCSRMGLACIPAGERKQKPRAQLSAYDTILDVGSRMSPN